MPHGVHISKRPSGCQQRKIKEAKKKLLETLAGTMITYVKIPDGGGQRPSSSKDTVRPQFPVANTDYSVVTMQHSAEEQGMEIAECEAEKQGVKMEEFEAEEDEEEGAESDSTYDLEVMSGAKEKILCDISSWEIPVPDHIRVEIIKRGTASFQNKDGPFTAVARQDAKAKGEVRQLSKDWFYQMMPNGEKIPRSWMMYSLISENLYCFCCRLFATTVTDLTSKFVSGFQTWWKLSPRVHNHETSKEHLCCLEKWKTLAAALRLHKNHDAENISVMEMETKKWRDILHRLLDITLFLAKQNLAFRVHNEGESTFNEWNFIEMVEFLSKYDVVLKEHLMRLKQSSSKLKVSVSYLSPQTQDEFISVLATHVKEKLVMDIRSAKYFGIMFDSTPGISHTDQMSEVIRYVKISSGKVEVKEVFLGFFPLKGKKAVDLSSDILKNLERDGLDIMMCRAQGYDNTVTMAGMHGGVQAIIREKNKKAVFNGCVDHSLNLCGQHSFAENASCVTFFGTFESMYSFFAASTHRWDVLTAHTGVSVKRLLTIRWSVHYAAVKSVAEQFDKFVAAIEALCDAQENVDTRGAAQVLLPAVCDFTFLCYLYFWCDVLREVNLSQMYLQTKGLTVDMVVTKLEALSLFLRKERSHLVEGAIKQAVLKSDECGIGVERRARFKKRMAAEQARDAGLTLQEEHKRAMLECIDRFHSELQIRSRAFKEVADRFEAVQARSLICAAEEELKVSVPKLTTFYDEVSESALLLEIPRLRRHLKAAQINLEEAKKWTVLDVLKFIAEWDFVESLPTLTISLRLFLTICVSVASCERSFSKLKLINNYLRSTMGQSRISDLAILSIESYLTKHIDFHDVINNFATLKARKVNF